MEVKMFAITCCNCGCLFAITDDMDNRLRKCHNTFYCPNGHPQSYTAKSEEERLREKIVEQDRSLAYFREQEKKRTEEAAKKRRKTKKAKK